MSPLLLRRKLLWLIGGRAVVVTLLLGSASLIVYRQPGAVTCVTIADPSSSVLMIARIAISQPTVRRGPASSIV